MSYELIISEKPNAAKKIAEALSDSKVIKETKNGVSYYKLSHNKKDIIVGCAVGHLYTVAEKEKSFKYPSYDLHWVASGDVDKNASFSKKYLNVLKKLAKDANSFTVACDYDIEGEVIGLNVVRFACKQKDAHRMKFSTLTKDDLITAYRNKEKTLDWGQGLAGETRHFLDWLYGINLSRALMLSIKAAGGFKVLSSGRVQGPALKIIVDKEKEIKAFVPVPYWQLELHSDKKKVEIISLHKEDKFWDKKVAEKIFKKCTGEDATVTAIKAKEFKQKPPTPFDLGSLQTESYKLFGYAPKRTLQMAQNLYLAGVTSYPRTSSQKLPKELGYKKILSALAKQDAYKKQTSFLLGLNSLKPNEGKKNDPAHPAIYPTGHLPKGITDQEKKVYDLVVKRFFAVFGEDAIRETVTATLTIKEEDFTTKGTTTKKKGWHDLYAPYVKLKEVTLPELKEKEVLKTKSLEFLEKETTPPKRYTPSSIINELEKRGLGTKATRADIVEALYKRGYVHEKSIEATELGIKTATTLEKYCPDILDEHLTREFEKEMEQIRSKKVTPEKILDMAHKALDKILGKFKKQEKIIGEELLVAERERRDEEATMGKCPKCDKGMLKVLYSRKTKKKFIGCTNYPDCKTAVPLPQHAQFHHTDKVCEHDGFPIIQIKQKRTQLVCLNFNCPGKQHEHPAEEKKTCTECGKPMAIKRSMYGEFWGCSGYPKCRHTESIKDANGDGKKKSFVSTKKKKTTKRVVSKGTAKKTSTKKTARKTAKSTKKSTK